MLQHSQFAESRHGPVVLRGKDWSCRNLHLSWLFEGGSSHDLSAPLWPHCGTAEIEAAVPCPYCARLFCLMTLCTPEAQLSLLFYSWRKSRCWYRRCAQSCTLWIVQYAKCTDVCFSFVTVVISEDRYEYTMESDRESELLEREFLIPFLRDLGPKHRGDISDASYARRKLKTWNSSSTTWSSNIYQWFYLWRWGYYPCHMYLSPHWEESCPPLRSPGVCAIVFAKAFFRKIEDEKKKKCSCFFLFFPVSVEVFSD